MARRRGSVLVIGYGNELRGDDGAGLSVAQRLTDCCMAARVIGVRQLYPELAVEIAAAACVVFVDAYVAGDADARLRVEQLSGALPMTALLGHHGTAEGLLALAARLYGTYPDAWLLAVPAFDFALGTTISPPTALRIEEAVAFCRALPRAGHRGRSVAQRRKECR